MKALFLSLLLLYSCTKYAEVSRDAMGVQITPVEMDITHLNEIEWLVGNPKEVEVSQSFTFLVEMPKIKQEDLDYLTDQKGVDAWILRLIVNRGSETQDLGSMYTLFRPRKLSRGNQGAGAATNVSMKVYYAAAYASERFRTFKCPAFGHDLKIDKMEIKGENEPFELSIGQTSPYLEKSQLVELTPSSFNGGNSLVGDYYVEIAPYNSKKKIIFSGFKRLKKYVSVSREEKIRIKSCDGVHPEIQ
ncbi:hypothetical protein [Peredibacter starrii]|uniref:Lipoprotein n=1 Tax=Peredibacter starrii TaxID=28202 RepID=A0AAX4HMY3_9BACT|nr:hypothetical protein [Peredibacter starrii]WPU64503.1 hypothetical protein SOO65_17550 [Peredibacter starrii]